MIRLALKPTLAGLLLLAAVSVSFAQDDDYRKLFKKPETVLDHWVGLKFELDVGRPDLAAAYLRGLVLKKPADKDLLDLVDRDGLTAIQRLRNVRQWSKVKEENEQALKDVDELITRTNEVVRKRLADPARIRDLISQLKATPEERIY